MTPRAPIAGLRHSLNRLEVKSNSAGVSPPSTPEVPNARKSGRSARAYLTGQAFRLYGFLSAQRRRLLPLTSRVAWWIDRRLVNEPVGAGFLRYTHRQLLSQRTGLAAAATKLIAIVLIASAQLHLAASQKHAASRAARLLNLIFRAHIRGRRGLASSAYFTTLALCGDYDRIVREVPRTEPINGFAVNFAVGTAHMYRSSYAVALHFLTAAAQNGDTNALRKLGCVHTLMGDHSKAAECFRASVEADPHSAMAHQNNAAGYDHSAYRPSEWELENAGELLIYDNLIQLGENFYHQGRYEDTFRCYQKALNHQARLSDRWAVPQPLLARIADACPHFKPDLPIRLLGYEWVTLIGHIGFLDCYARMASLGMYPNANYVLLAPPSKVVNRAFLELWGDFFCIIKDHRLVDDLLPYQRLVGDQFIGFRSNGELAEPWAHAASRAQVKWSQAGRAALVNIPEECHTSGISKLGEIGIPRSAWFVTLHIREGGFHGDGAGSTRQHRSANVDDYMPAIRYIVESGGYVVRLGDKSMTPITGVSGLFDYAHSELKSEQMDLFLTSACDFFIGTTSGLTSAVQALGTPMLLLNCTSNDCQFWHDQTDFIVKPVYDRRRRRYLSFCETYHPPLQAALIDGAALDRHGCEIHPNSSEDILAAVRYKLACRRGTERRMGEDDDLMKRYRRSLANNPFNFGAARPVRPFLETHGELLGLQD